MAIYIYMYLKYDNYHNLSYDIQIYSSITYIQYYNTNTVIVLVKINTG